MQFRHWRPVPSRLFAFAWLALLAQLPACETAAVRDRQARPGARGAKDSKNTRAWTVGIGSGALVLAVVGTLAFLSTRKRPARTLARKDSPPPLPEEPHVTPAVVSTAICTKPSVITAALPRTPCDELNPPPILLPPANAIQSGPPRPSHPVALPAPDVSTGVRLPGGPDSRGPTSACGRCGWLVPADLGAPPWCPHCGSDLKPTMPPSAAATGQAGVGAGPSLLQPPYFVGRMKRSYRVYVLPKQLLFIDCPTADDRTATEKVVMGVSIQGGLVGAMIGSAIAGAIQQDRLAKTRDRNWTLNLADVRELVAIAELENGSFALDIEDLRDVVIEALTFWQRTFTERCSARLRFLHPVRGPLTFDLPRPIDVGVAIKQLTPLLEKRITVNATWDWGKNRYVQKA